MLYDIILVTKPFIFNDLQLLTKQQLAELIGQDFPANTKKADIIIIAAKRIENNELMISKLYAKYSETLAIHPAKVEEIIKCTRTERKRWTKQERLVVVGYEPFRKAGKNLTYPVFDRLSVYKITPELVEEWRKADAIKTRKSIKEGVSKAKITKKENEKQKDNFIKEWKKLIVSWTKVDSRLAAIFQLAYWTVWVSIWAEENQVKQMNAKTKQDVYKQRAVHLYQLKNDAIKLLHEMHENKITFYRPEMPHKEDLHLCKDHYYLWKVFRHEIGYITQSSHVNNTQL